VNGQEQILTRPSLISEEESNDANVFIQQELYGLGERVSYNPLDYNLGVFESLKRTEPLESGKNIDLFTNSRFDEGMLSWFLLLLLV